MRSRRFFGEATSAPDLAFVFCVFCISVSDKGGAGRFAIQRAFGRTLLGFIYLSIPTFVLAYGLMRYSLNILFVPFITLFVCGFSILPLSIILLLSSIITQLSS